MRLIDASIRTAASALSGFRRRIDGARAGVLVAATLVACGLTGCGTKTIDEATATAAFERLHAVGAAYRQATARRGSPPASADDLREACPAGMTPEEFLTSPVDGEPLTVFWGTDPMSGMDLNPLVLAHEKTGGPTGRLVLTTMGVMLMPADSFAKARFPEPASARTAPAKKERPR